MPSAPADLDRATAIYRARLLTVRDRSVNLVLAGWVGLDIYNRRGVGDWALAGETLIGGAQREIVAASDGYVASVVAAATREATGPVGLDDAPWVGRTARGTRLAETLVRAAIVARWLRSEGVDPADARARGAALLVRRVRTEVADTGRSSLRSAMTHHPRIIGYRVVSATSRCKVCSAIAAGGLRSVDTAVRFHDHCRCSLQPVVQ